MAEIILPLSPIPPIPFLVALSGKENVVFDAGEHFVKQTIRSRYHILTANGVLALSLNVVGQKGIKTPTGEVEIDYRKNWVRDHLRAIESAYRPAPFFEHYFPEVEEILGEKHARLGELFESALPRWLRLLGMEISLRISSEYIETQDGLDLRNRIKNPDQFPKELESRKYLQVFSDRFDFQPNLSVIDLLMNEGPAAKSCML